MDSSDSSAARNSKTHDNTKKKKLKVLVTGATGMLGRSLIRHLNQTNNNNNNNNNNNSSSSSSLYHYETIGTGYTRANPPTTYKLNLLNTSEITSFLTQTQPNIVVHCAAERFPDRASANPQRTEQLNIQSTSCLVRTCAKLGIFFIYISTDYVFDGGLVSGVYPPYKVMDETNPMNLYGVTKWKGEEVVRSSCGCGSTTSDRKLEEEGEDEGECGTRGKAVIVRIPVLYALDCEDLSESASLVVAKSLLSSKKAGTICTVDNWGKRYPTLVDDVSAVLRLIIDASQQEEEKDDDDDNHDDDTDDPISKGNGKILHISSSEQCTKYELTQLMAKILGIDGSHIQPDSNPPSGAARPQNTHLDCSETWDALGIKEKGGYMFVDLEDGIRRALLPFMDLFPKSMNDEKCK